MLLDLFKSQNGTSSEWQNCSIHSCSTFGVDANFDNYHDPTWLHFNVRISR